MKLTSVKLPFPAITIGCMLLGAAGAAAYRASAAAPATATLASVSPAIQSPMPLFVQAAFEAPAPAAWPPGGAVAFYQEMFALRSATAPRTPRLSANPQVAALDPASSPAPVRDSASELPPHGNDTVEIVIRDRFGRPIRVERVDRRLLDPRLYPPPRYGAHGPYGAYDPYGPYRR